LSFGDAHNAKDSEANKRRRGSALPHATDTLLNPSHKERSCTEHVGGDFSRRAFSAGMGQRPPGLAQLPQAPRSGLCLIPPACLHQTSRLSISSALSSCTKRKLLATHISAIFKKPAHPPIPPSLDFPKTISRILKPQSAFPHHSAVSSTTGQSTIHRFHTQLGLSPQHPKLKQQKIPHLTAVTQQDSLPLPPTRPRRQPDNIQAQCATKALFMYQHEKDTVFRHDPPLELRPFRIAWKPSSYNISDG
jgi:hypothetical protein